MAPRELQAEAELYHKNVTEMARVMLSWQAPADLGNAYLVRYEYRYAARGVALSSAEWYHGSARSTRTVSYLEPGTAYSFEVRAVTLAGAARGCRRPPTGACWRWVDIHDSTAARAIAKGVNIPAGAPRAS